MNANQTCPDSTCLDPAKLRRAVSALLLAYAQGAANDATMDWADVDHAFGLAKEALPGVYEAHLKALGVEAPDVYYCSECGRTTDEDPEECECGARGSYYLMEAIEQYAEARGYHLEGFLNVWIKQANGFEVTIANGKSINGVDFEVQIMSESGSSVCSGPHPSLTAAIQAAEKEMAPATSAAAADATCPGADATCPPQAVWVLAYVHGHGDDVTVYRSKESALAAAKEIIDRYIDDEEEAEEMYQTLIECSGTEVEPGEWLSVQDAVVLP